MTSDPCTLPLAGRTTGVKKTEQTSQTLLKGAAKPRDHRVPTFDLPRNLKTSKPLRGKVEPTTRSPRAVIVR
jgi:hypothetical protein